MPLMYDSLETITVATTPPDPMNLDQTLAPSEGDPTDSKKRHRVVIFGVVSCRRDPTLAQGPQRDRSPLWLIAWSGPIN